MTLRLYNTLTRRKDEFRPIDKTNVRMYVCGPTVYDLAHIGNARPVVVFDVLYRLLRHLYGEQHVKYVRNITDVDDKINARALESHPGVALNEAIARVTARTTEQFHRDIVALGVLKPDVEPLCTGHIGEMITMIETLIAKGHAYVGAGHVLLDTASVPGYGRLSGRTLDEMIAGARVEVAPYKKNPADSVLWKPSSDEQPGWDSPWGRGRPGWHIECSAMAWKHLGETFDIHGGGIDLTFPHHENELAQSTCAHGTQVMANVWMHNGFLQVEGKKMAKSEGNFVTIKEALDSWGGAVLRLNMLKTHYRQPIDWTQASLKDSERELRRWIGLVSDGRGDNDADVLDVVDMLSDDLNTPATLALMRRFYKEKQPVQLARAAALMGISLDENDLNVKRGAAVHTGKIEVSGYLPGVVATDKVETLIENRSSARAAKDFAEADRIRNELDAMGIALKDGPDGTTWEVKRNA